MDPGGAAGSSCQTAAGPPSGRGHACGQHLTAQLRGAACSSCCWDQLTAAAARVMMRWRSWAIFRPAIADFPKLIRLLIYITSFF